MYVFINGAVMYATDKPYNFETLTRKSINQCLYNCVYSIHTTLIRSLLNIHNTLKSEFRVDKCVAQNGIEFHSFFWRSAHRYQNLGKSSCQLNFIVIPLFV